MGRLLVCNPCRMEYLWSDPGSCALATQEFRNALQREKESVSDYITRVEQSFQITYGHERLTLETRDAFLYSHL